MADDRRLKIFEAHGVTFTGERGDELYGTCPFTGKADKFYVNRKTLLWDSKTAGVGGNIPKFLDLIARQYERDLSVRHVAHLADDRKLPVEAFQGWGIGWNGVAYTIPIRDPRGVTQDIRTYRIGQRVMSTAACETGMLGADRLPAHHSESVYVCEGEWDAIALGWLLRRNRADGVVLGIPGAGVFKDAWREWLAGRVVFTLYDADEAGDNGELQAQKRLSGAARAVFFTHWPDGVPTGFDVRDYVIYGAIQNKKPKTCWASLQRKFRSLPRKKAVEDLPVTTTPADERMKQLASRPSNWERSTPSFADLVTTFRKWLFLPNTIGIEAMLATMVSQQIDGPPIWMFLVAPPGGAKTETLTSLSQLQNVYMTSSLTPHALISGASWKGDKDPSLIPKLNGKVMVIKDFTSILSMRDAEKDEIFGILRDAYDGRCGKVFGTGIERTYESRFTVLAAVTPRIYDLSQQHHALGERFLKCTVGDNLQHDSERDIIRRAIDNIERDTDMKWELQDVVTAYVMKRGMDQPISRGVLPTLPPDMKNRLIALGMFGARLRGTVSRDAYHNDIMTGRPSAEIGTRLGVQLAKFARSLALVHGRDAVAEVDFALVKKIMLDTINQRTEDMVRQILKKCPTIDDTISTQDLAIETRYPIATVSRLMQDLNVLDVVVRLGTRYRYSWTLSPYIRNAITASGVYTNGIAQGRPLVRVARRKSAYAVEMGAASRGTRRPVLDG